MKKIYLDYAATTPMDSAVEKVMRPYFSRVFGNPSSTHWFGQEASAAVFSARRKIAAAVGADYTEVIFTGSATEANNLALRGVARAAVLGLSFFGNGVTAFQRRGAPQSRPDASRFNIGTTEPSGLRHVPQDDISSRRPRIIISSIEHESILETARDLEQQGLIEVVYIPVNHEGIVDVKKLEAALDEQTALVSIQYANSEIGVIQPIKEIAKIISDFRNSKFSPPAGGQDSGIKNRQFLNHESQIMNHYPLFHTDAVQAFQFLPCIIDELGVDMMAVSAHKIYGPKGIGALCVKNPKSETRNPQQIQPRASTILQPQIVGGGQEFGIRSGTENVPAIVGFAQAVELVEILRTSGSNRIKSLRDYFWKELKKIAPDAEINGSIEKGLPHILNVYFPGRSAQDLCIEFDLMGIAVSPGTACSSRAAQPSSVIQALAPREKDRPSSSIRFSFGRPTTREELQRALALCYKLGFAKKRSF